MCFNVLTELSVLAAGAKTVEGQLAACHPASGTGFNIAFQGFGYLDLGEIQNCVGARADEVDMGFGICIEPFRSADRCHAHDGSLALEESQVPVHCCQ